MRARCRRARLLSCTCWERPPALLRAEPDDVHPLQNAHRYEEVAGGSSSAQHCRSARHPVGSRRQRKMHVLSGEPRAVVPSSKHYHKATVKAHNPAMCRAVVCGRCAVVRRSPARRVAVRAHGVVRATMRGKGGEAAGVRSGGARAARAQRRWQRKQPATMPVRPPAVRPGGWR